MGVSILILAALAAPVAFAQTASSTLRVGLTSGVTASGFTLNAQSGKTYAVNLLSDTKVFVNGQASSASSLANGMYATVKGTWTDTTKTGINAMVVRVQIRRSYHSGGTSTSTTSTPR